MIDGVEFAVIDQIDHVRRFDHGHAIVGKDGADALDETVEVGDMGQDVVGQEEVGSGRMVGAQFLRQSQREVRFQRGDAFRNGFLRRAVRRIDAEHGDAFCNEVAEHVAIVACCLDHPTASVQISALDQLTGAVTEMAHQSRRNRGIVRVILSEKDVGRDGNIDLRQRTIRAEHQVERGQQFGFGKLVGGEQAVGQRRLAKRNDRNQVIVAAGTAGCGLLVHKGIE